MFKNYLKHTSRVITNHHFYPESSQGWLLLSSRTQWCKWHQNYIHIGTNINSIYCFVTNVNHLHDRYLRYGNCTGAIGVCTKTTHKCHMYVTADFQRTFHTYVYLHNEQGHTVHSYGSFTVIRPKDKKISAEQTGYSHSKKNYLRIKVTQVLPIWHAKLHDIMRDLCAKNSVSTHTELSNLTPLWAFYCTCMADTHNFTVHMFITL
jgi:hypothetical protein